MFLSTNNGTNWTATGLQDTIVSAFAVNVTNLFAGNPYGVFLSTSNGTSWTDLNSGFSNNNVHAFAVSGTNLFAGTYGGDVWRRPLSEMITSVERLSTDVPTHFSLDQNYPNPFNPSTTIKYQIPRSGLVNLKVYDILGKEVSTFVNENKIRGLFEVNFDASKLANGIYIYQLKINDFVSSKKMLLLK